MPNETPPLTDEEKYELALQTEAELARLSRTYTIMERNRNEFMASGLSGKLAKHKKVLDIFKREQNNILTDLKVASAGARKQEDLKLSRRLTYLLVEYDVFDNEISTQRNYTKEIEDQIQMVKKKLLELAGHQITEDKYQERVLKGQNTVETLENKLEVQMKKFCAICADNVQLRSEIHHLLNERNEFNKIWEKLIKNLCVGKKFMIDLIEQATIAYDQREEWVSKLTVLRHKAHNDMVAHIQIMREMQRKKDNDTKLQEFFATKGQKRVLKDLEEQQIKNRQIKKAMIECELEKYLNMLIEIKDFAQKESIPSIAKEFVHQEEENFARFKYVNDLNKQMEELSDDMTKYTKEIDEQQKLHESWKTKQEETLKLCEDLLEKKRNEANDKEAELRSIDQKLNTVLNGIGTLFKLFRCNNDPLIHLLGHNETIHNNNALLYLEILERNIHEALVTVHYKEASTSKKKKTGKPETFVVRQDMKPQQLDPVDSICKTNPCPLCIEHELVSDVIDELQFAYTKKEIKEKLKARSQMDDTVDALHNVSACHLPKSRQIIQKRYQ